MHPEFVELLIMRPLPPARPNEATTQFGVAPENTLNGW
jgi:hypothetical protein